MRNSGIASPKVREGRASRAERRHRRPRRAARAQAEARASPSPPRGSGSRGGSSVWDGTDEHGEDPRHHAARVQGGGRPLHSRQRGGRRAPCVGLGLRPTRWVVSGRRRRYKRRAEVPLRAIRQCGRDRPTPRAGLMYRQRPSNAPAGTSRAVGGREWEARGARGVRGALPRRAPAPGFMRTAGLIYGTAYVGDRGRRRRE